MEKQKHKFAVGTKIQFPNFEILMEAGWTDDGEYIVHPIFDKTILLSYLQICDFEDKEVTIMHQHEPGEYSIEEDGLHDDWPFDLMPMRKLISVPLDSTTNLWQQNIKSKSTSGSRQILKFVESKEEYNTLQANFARFIKDFDRLSKQLHRIANERDTLYEENKNRRQ